MDNKTALIEAGGISKLIGALREPDDELRKNITGMFVWVLFFSKFLDCELHFANTKWHSCLDSVQKSTCVSWVIQLGAELSVQTDGELRAASVFGETKREQKRKKWSGCFLESFQVSDAVGSRLPEAFVLCELCYHPHPLTHPHSLSKQSLTFFPAGLRVARSLSDILWLVFISVLALKPHKTLAA